MKKIGLLLLLGLVVIPALAQNKNFIDQPYLETSASVDTLVVPDKIHLLIVLNEEDSRNKRSTEELETAMVKVLNSLEIDLEKDLSLLDYNSEFKKYFFSGQKILKTKVFTLVVKDANTVGRVMAGLEGQGISNVSINKTEYTKAEELLLALKTKAIKKARVNAEKLVEPLGQKLGKAIYINDLEGGSIGRQLQGKAAGILIRGSSSLYGNMAPQQLSLEFDKMSFSAQVQLKFKLE